MARIYAYGFNLGQIEGLDSSVKTVTLTIANATESSTYTLTYTTEGANELWTDDINFEHDTIRLYHYANEVFELRTNFLTDSDVGDTYNVTLSTSAVEENFKSAVETVLVDNGLIGESETLFDGTLTLVDEELYYELPSDFPDGWYENAVCTVNGMEILKDPETEYGFMLLTDAINVTVYYVPSDGEYPAALRFSYCDVPNDYAIIPGDYQVKIVTTNESQSDSSNFNIALFDYNEADGTYSCNLSYDQMVNVDGEGFTRSLKPIIGVISRGKNTSSSVSQTVRYDPRQNILEFYFAAFETGNYGVFKIQLNKNGLITEIAGSTNVTVTWN